MSSLGHRVVYFFPTLYRLKDLLTYAWELNQHNSKCGFKKVGMKIENYTFFSSQGLSFHMKL